MSDNKYDTSMEELIKVEDARIYIDELTDYDKLTLVSGCIEEYRSNCITRLRMIDEGWSQDGRDLHMSGMIRFIMVIPSDDVRDKS